MTSIFHKICTILHLCLADSSIRIFLYIESTLYFYIILKLRLTIEDKCSFICLCARGKIWIDFFKASYSCFVKKKFVGFKECDCFVNNSTITYQYYTPWSGISLFLDLVFLSSNPSESAVVTLKIENAVESVFCLISKRRYSKKSLEILILLVRFLLIMLE